MKKREHGIVRCIKVERGEKRGPSCFPEARGRPLGYPRDHVTPVIKLLDVEGKKVAETKKWDREENKKKN